MFSFFFFPSSRLHLQRGPTGGSRAHLGSAAGEDGRTGPEPPRKGWVVAAGARRQKASWAALPLSRGWAALSGSSCRAPATPPPPLAWPGRGGRALHAVPPSGVGLQVQPRLLPEPRKAALGCSRQGCPTDPALVLCCRRPGQGSGRHYRAAICAELKKTLTIEEVAPRPVGPHEVGGCLIPFYSPLLLVTTHSPQASFLNQVPSSQARGRPRDWRATSSWSRRLKPFPRSKVLKEDCSPKTHL